MIAWNDNFIMGVEALDEEHKQLFRLAEQILNRIRTQGSSPSMRMFVLREGLNYLQGYFDRHAVQEEAYMRQIGYPDYALHKMQHEGFRRVQMTKYRRMVDSGFCSREDIMDFVGSGIGWLLEHIATADMAIVGKGILNGKAEMDLDISVLERELDRLFAATLNIEANTKVINRRYGGEPFGKTVCQKFIYSVGERNITVISGIERTFLLDVARSLYGDYVEDEMDLVLSTLEAFSANFWITLCRQLTGSCSRIDVREKHFLVSGSLAEELQRLRPTVSMLFTSDQGKFFVASDSATLCA